MEDTNNFTELQHEFYDGVNYNIAELKTVFVMITRSAKMEFK